MATIDAIEIPKLLFDEGAAPSTPASTNVALYAKADGLLYSKDDAGTETLVSSGSATSGVPSGSSNPGGPATNDLFLRTDLGMIFQYNGTRWLCTCPHESPLVTSETPTQPATGTATVGYGALDNITLDLWIERIVCATTVITTNNGTNFWTVSVSRDPSGTSLGSFSTGTTPDTAGTSTRHNITVGALSGTSDRYWRVLATKTLSPGGIYVFSWLKFRYVAA